MASHNDVRHAEASAKQTFTLDRRRQLQDIVTFETHLRDEYKALQREKQRSLVILSGLLLCNLVSWINIIWSTEESSPVAYIGKLNKLSFCLDNVESDSLAIIPLIISLASVTYFFLSDTHKTKISDANRFVSRCNSVLQHYRVYFCAKTGKLYPLTTSTRLAKVEDEKLTWWQKIK